MPSSLVVLAAAVAVALLVAPPVLGARVNVDHDTMRSESAASAASPSSSASSCPLPQVAVDAAVARFAQLLQFETVSDRSAPSHVRKPEEFDKLHTYLEQAFPLVWSSLTVEQVGDAGHSLLLTWPGTKPELDPLLFISHLDVVPVATETLDQWTYPPFSGAVAEGYIWGRGALDVKVGVAGLLEAVSLLLEEGWRPTRTVLLGFGQDEEVGGDLGAGATAALLRSRGVDQLDAVIDEGSVVFAEGFPPYTTAPVALVATAEKGYYSVQVTVAGHGGHSSVPPIDGSSAGAAVARLLLHLEDHQPPAALVPPITDFLRAIAPSVETPWLRQIFAHPENPAYAERILSNHLLVDTPLTAALARTTVAVTGLSAYVGDNVLPPAATVNLNFRLLPGADVQLVQQYVHGLIDDLGLNATVKPVRPDASEGEALATPVTSASGRHFLAIKQALQEGFPAVNGNALLVAPYMLTGGTDSRHYLPFSKNGVLRFVPVTARQSAGDGSRVHGLNERLSVEDLARAVCVYRRAVQLLAGA